MLNPSEPLMAIFYDKNMKYIALSAIYEETIKEDYLSLEKTTFTVLNDIADISDAVFVEIREIYNRNSDSFIGIVESVIDTSEIMQVDAMPIMKMFDAQFNCAFGAAIQNVPGVGLQVMNQLLQAMRGFLKTDSHYYHYTDNRFRPFPIAIEMDAKSENPDNFMYEMPRQLNNIFDAASALFKYYSVVVTSKIVATNPDERHILLHIRVVDNNAGRNLNYIDADLGNVLSLSVNDESKNTVNLITVYNKDTYPLGSHTLKTYVRRDDGLIVTLDDNGYQNMKTIVQGALEAENKDFENGNIAELAKTELDFQKYKTAIEISYRVGDGIVNMETLEVGSRVSIKAKGKLYDSVLSGYEINGGIVKYIFGYGRNTLTQKLGLERRK